MTLINSFSITTLILFLFTATAPVPSNQFFGKWIRDDGAASYEFKNGDKCIWDNKSKSLKCKYKFPGDDHIRIDVSIFGISTGETYKFSLSENVMSLIDSKKKDHIYIKADFLESNKISVETMIKAKKSFTALEKKQNSLKSLYNNLDILLKTKLAVHEKDSTKLGKVLK
jgi:hypothetical protein